MKNSPDKSHFEDQWKQAFEGKEITPSPNVWKGIDAHLANQQAGDYKRSALFYRWVAAASVVILLGWTGFYLVNRSAETEGLAANENSDINADVQESAITQAEDPESDSGNQLAESAGSENELRESGSSNTAGMNSQIAENEDTEELELDDTTEDENLLATNEAGSEDHEAELSEEESNGTSHDGAGTVILASTEEPVNPTSENTEAGISNTPLSESILVSGEMFAAANEDLGLRKNNPLGFDIVSADMPVLEPGEIPVWDFDLPEDENFEDQSLFAGLNFSPGVFDPNFSNSSAAAENLSDASFNVPVSQSLAESTVNQGFSYGVGMNAGFPLGRKWVLQGGLEYQVGRSETSTSLIVESASGARSALTFTNSVEAEDLSNTVSISSPTDVTSDYRFLSVPLKAGYSILDKEKFGLMISGGISSDFFLSNTISSDQEGVSSFRQSSGSGSPFRTVYFSGLSSVTLSYKLTSNYLILLEPSFKAALSDFSKSSEVFNSRPNSFGIGVGVRYRFR